MRVDKQAETDTLWDTHTFSSASVSNTHIPKESTHRFAVVVIH